VLLGPRALNRADLVVFFRFGLSLEWGGALLMALGAQWYILFNTIAGAMAIPNDLREMARDLGVRGACSGARSSCPLSSRLGSRARSPPRAALGTRASWRRS